jgi:hypothetical protein
MKTKEKATITAAEQTQGKDNHFFHTNARIFIFFFFPLHEIN